MKEKAVGVWMKMLITMSIEAARNALKRAEISPSSSGRSWVGSDRTRTRSNPAARWCGKPLALGQRECWRIGSLCVTKLGGGVSPGGGVGHGGGVWMVGSGMADYVWQFVWIPQGKPATRSNTRSSGGAAYIIGPQLGRLSA